MITCPVCHTPYTPTEFIALPPPHDGRWWKADNPEHPDLFMSQCPLPCDNTMSVEMPKLADARLRELELLRDEVAA